MKLHWIFDRYMAPAGDDLSTGGGAADRGDDFTPTDDDAADTSVAAGAEDEDAEGGEADEEGADGKEEGDKKDDKSEPKRQSGKRIPLDRHEKILAKEREKRQEAERQLAQFQQGRQVAQANADLTKVEDKLVELEGKYNSALVDGDSAEANKLMREIRTLDRQIAEARADMRSAEAEARAVEQVRYSTALERIEETFAELNPDHDDYDEELTQDVIDLKATYERRGMTPTQALQKAVKRLVEVDTRAQRDATEVAPRVKKEDVAAQRKKEAVTKTADAVKRTPPNAAKVGQDSDRAGGALRQEDVMKMSQDDFARLDERELSRLRGDAF